MKCPYINPTPDQCFKCPYPDCVNDDLSFDELNEDVIPTDIPREVKMARMRSNRYAEKHREEIRKRSLDYYYDNRESLIKKSKEWQKENRYRIAAAKRKRYQDNLEQERQKQRDYRAKKKAEN